MFTIEMLSANEGDALWIEYGDKTAPKRLLIDCGYKKNYRTVAERLGADPTLGFELIVLTHVDADHIAGAIPLLLDDRLGPDRVRDVWFNEFDHLSPPDSSDSNVPDTLGARQGEFFGGVLHDRGYPWNRAFGGGAVVVEDEGELPRMELDGGMVLTLLSPSKPKLAEMRERWSNDLKGSGIAPGDWQKALQVLGTHGPLLPDVLGSKKVQWPPDIERLAEEDFTPDASEPNGSSIAFLAEFGDRTALFAGDAHAPLLAANIRRLLRARGLDRLPLDAFKMSHHGSARNNSQELLELLDCKRYLISTNGNRHNHPNAKALARVLTVNDHKVTLIFNYRSDETGPWDDDDLRRQHNYGTVYPAGDETGVRVEL
uniref:Metallo-beta-lactamase superfamily protein n=1 Tax=Candidatus Kentrum sp. FW TaxID=2126338 RepID=A0A450T9D5_9GAMM|nr:MAG: hypothetical protein BECKFW1821B_GA0114236_108111 [Candidatus Kentron sp. FW]